MVHFLVIEFIKKSLILKGREGERTLGGECERGEGREKGERKERDR